MGSVTEVPENIGAGEGNRTLVISLEGCCSTIELHPRTLPLRQVHSLIQAGRGGQIARPTAPAVDSPGD